MPRTSTNSPTRKQASEVEIMAVSLAPPAVPLVGELQFILSKQCTDNNWGFKGSRTDTSIVIGLLTGPCAERAGLQPGDEILSANGMGGSFEAIDEGVAQAGSQLILLVRRPPPGSRDGKSKARPSAGCLGDFGLDFGLVCGFSDSHPEQKPPGDETQSVVTEELVVQTGLVPRMVAPGMEVVEVGVFLVGENVQVVIEKPSDKKWGVLLDGTPAGLFCRQVKDDGAFNDCNKSYKLACGSAPLAPGDTVVSVNGVGGANGYAAMFAEMAKPQRHHSFVIAKKGAHASPQWAPTITSPVPAFSSVQTLASPLQTISSGKIFAPQANFTGSVSTGQSYTMPSMTAPAMELTSYTTPQVQPAVYRSATR